MHSSSGQLGEAGNTDEGNLKTIEERPAFGF